MGLGMWVKVKRNEPKEWENEWGKKPGTTCKARCIFKNYTLGSIYLTYIGGLNEPTIYYYCCKL